MNTKENTYLKLAVGSLSFLALWNVVVGIKFIWEYIRANQLGLVGLGPTWSNLAIQWKTAGTQATTVGIFMLIITYFLLKKKKIAWWLSVLSIVLVFVNDFTRSPDINVFLVIEALILLVASYSLIKSKSLFNSVETGVSLQ